jgi:hypothetical protein
MNNLILLGIAVIIAFGAIGTWTTASTPDRGQAYVALAASISPLELMRAVPTNLPHEQFDAH